MSFNIPSVLPGTPATDGRSSNQAPASQPEAVRQAPLHPEDTVKLSTSQRVYQLHLQGQRVSQIASALNLSEAAVNTYLNLTNKTG